MPASRAVVYGVAIVVGPIVAAVAASFAAIAIYDTAWGPADNNLTPSLIGGITAFVTWMTVTVLTFKRVSPVKPGQTWPYLPERDPQHPSDAWARGPGWPDVSTGGADVRSSVIHDPRIDEPE